MPQYRAIIRLGTLDGRDGFRLSTTQFSSLGDSVAGAGDVNADGFHDIIIGDPSAQGGTAYVVFGHAGPFARNVSVDALNGVDGFSLSGAYGRLGSSVSSAGDVNADGYADIVVGAPYTSRGNTSVLGSTFFVFGHASPFPANVNVAELDGSNGFRVDGVDEFDLSGAIVSSVGDVNGDGFADVIISASGGDPSDLIDAGECYVVYGRASGFAPVFDPASLDGANGFRIDGAVPFGVDLHVGPAGDVNGDGLSDLIIGAPGVYPDGDPFRHGVSYVVFGAPDMPAAFQLSMLNGLNGFRLDGGSPGSGVSVASADVNSDGFDDLLVGASGGSGIGGVVYVVFGKPDGFAADLDLRQLDGADGFRLDLPINADGSSVVTVRSAGDFNGDGFEDVIIGDARAGTGFAGRAYVVFGKASGFDTAFDLASLNGNTGFRLDGIDAYDAVGVSVASAGDMNADGFSDLIIGARGAGEARGAAFVVFGGKPATAVTRVGTDIANRINGGDYGDTLRGLGGDDFLMGWRGNDLLEGGLGNDTLEGGPGDDRLFGGEGLDTASYSSAGSGVQVDLSKSGSQRTGAGADWLTSVENLIGSGFADRLRGNSEINVIDGGGGDDLLFGGRGADHFVFDAGDGADRITDFEDGLDLLDLRGYAGAAYSNTSIASVFGGHTLITLVGGESILLVKVGSASISEADFLFG